jgi:hypothetical protein
MTTVTDADRKAAADLRMLLPPLADQRVIAAMRDGALDCIDMVQAFARHREQAILEGMEMMREAIAQYLEGRRGGAIPGVHIRNLDPAAILEAHTRVTE